MNEKYGWGYAVCARPPLTLGREEAVVVLKGINSILQSGCESPENETELRRVAIKIQKWINGEYR